MNIIIYIIIFVCSNWQNIWKFCPSGWISSRPMNIGFRYFTYALTTIPTWILWSFVRIKFKIVDFSSFLLAQIDKLFENFVRPDEYLQHQWIFVSDNLHMHWLQCSHESLQLTTEVLPGGGYHCDIFVDYNLIIWHWITSATI